jgi:hypothetical protein
MTVVIETKSRRNIAIQNRDKIGLNAQDRTEIKFVQGILNI